jgi:hypothetical protein
MVSTTGRSEGMPHAAITSRAACWGMG